jgi:HemY protein
MRNLIVLVLLTALAVGLSLTANVNPGQVAIFFNPYRIDLSLNLAILLILFGFLLFYGLLRAVNVAIKLPDRVREFKKNRQRESAHYALCSSVIDFHEGRLSRVEKWAAQAQNHELDGHAAAFIAASAAHQLLQYDRRDKWLDLLFKNQGATIRAAQILAAQCFEQQGDYAKAQQMIELVLKGNRRNLRAQQLSIKIHRSLGNWSEVLRTSRLLINRVPSPEGTTWDALITEVYQNLIARGSQSVATLWQLWRQATPKELGVLEVLRNFAVGFARAGAPIYARNLIEEALEKEWRDELVQLFAEIFYAQPASAIPTLLKWQNQQPQALSVYRALALLSAASQDWVAAAKYFEYIMSASPSAHVAASLVQAYEQQGLNEKAFYYQQRCVSLLLNV